jgi:hypothetical protein
MNPELVKDIALLGKDRILKDLVSNFVKENIIFNI